MKYKKISWQELIKDCTVLARKIKKGEVDEIIAISRGGSVIGRIFSDLLSLPMNHIALASYVDFVQQREPQIIGFLTKQYNRERVLLIDDLSDTGKTFQQAVRYLNTKNIKKIYTLAPYIKPHTTFFPDYYLRNIDAWIIFPYELHETRVVFEKQYGKSAKNKLKKVGFSPWEIV